MFGTAAARASWVEPLLMPGEVAAKHAKLEHQCEKCHAPFDKQAQDRLCLACHEEVAADLGEKRGYHGRDPAVSGQVCKTCHTEHEGRDAEIVRLNRHTFEHRYTDMPLREAHLRVPCEQCHAAGKRYRDAAAECSHCHGQRDPHEGSVGAACDRCHQESAWKTVRFDHDAAFRLEGRHRQAECQKCHPSKRYKPTARDCHTCHQSQDRHRGALGMECQSCHTPRAWSTTFDHRRRTHFPLQGRHAGAACESCHRPGMAAADAPTSCRGCHERDDAHQGRFGPACESCHVPVEWRRHTFDHARSAGYPLRGRHAAAPCTACHRGAVRQEHLQTACVSCHRADDVHHGSQGSNCKGCHDEGGWSRGVLIDHDSTRFPLSGAHVRLTCMQCHMSSSFKDVARDCMGCHQKDDVHRGRLGPRCERCHEASSFKVTHEPR